MPAIPPPNIAVRVRLILPWGDVVTKEGIYYDTPQSCSLQPDLQAYTAGFITVEPDGIGIYDPNTIIEWEAL